eukprot:8681030-Pyramimonas_sp.AAC.1
MEEEEAAPPNTPPELRLVGPAVVEVEQFASYTRCTEFSKLSDVCDRGATATDAEEGDLTARVLACTPDGVRNRFAKRGVAACGVDTASPGTYNVTFFVAD